MIKNVFGDVGVEVDILEKENFLKIKETLERIGVCSNKKKKLYQSAHILHKRDEDGNSHYAIVHFLEMFKLDGKPSNITESDIDRRNAIARLLEQWGLLKVVDRAIVDENYTPKTTLKILRYHERNDWELVQKYNVGGNGGK